MNKIRIYTGFVTRALGVNEKPESYTTPASTNSVIIIVLLLLPICYNDYSIRALKYVVFHRQTPTRVIHLDQENTHRYIKLIKFFFRAIFFFFLLLT